MTDQPRPARSLEDRAAAVLNTVMAVLLGGAAACLFLYGTAENAADIAAQWSADGTIDWIGVVRRRRVGLDRALAGESGRSNGLARLGSPVPQVKTPGGSLHRGFRHVVDRQGG